MVSDAQGILSTFTALPLTGVLALVLLALLPLALLAVTSFLKVSVVLSILRSALGAQGIPSAAVTALLALILTVHIMRPVGEEMVRTLATRARQPTPSLGARIDLKSLTDLMRTAAALATPLERFLRLQSGMRERHYFIAFGSGVTLRAPILNHSIPARTADPLPGESFVSLVPAFVFSELSAACAIGVRIYLPFLVIDLVIASLLVGVGMSMVSPVTVALPLKLLLFVTVDGWLLLAEGLVQSYATAL